VGSSEAGGVPNRDSRPELEAERAVPRHLKPEDFGRDAPPLVDETAALRAAGDDIQLRTAVQHLKAWRKISKGKRRR
jgi:carboxyl-terminal processing protease